ncbi:MAG: hypothetical protein Ct9H300mP1_16760 [Planctomycetaceae bacterium]|nr:MAG: hypothetical protein Ct9H300mP1_16760 [Planctomycetaceae bacterium]
MPGAKPQVRPAATKRFLPVCELFQGGRFWDTSLNLSPQAFQASKAKYDAALKPLTDAVRHGKRVACPADSTSGWPAGRRPRPRPHSVTGTTSAPSRPPTSTRPTTPPRGPGKTPLQAGADLGRSFLKGTVSWQVQPGWTDGKIHNTLTGNNAANYLVRTIDSPSALAVEFAFGGDEA